MAGPLAAGGRGRVALRLLRHGAGVDADDAVQRAEAHHAGEEGHEADELVAAALGEVGRAAAGVKLLGSYPQAAP